MLNRNFIDRLAQLGGGIAAIIMLLMTCHMLLEIVLRNLFGVSTYVVDEFVGYGTSAITFLALAYTLNHGALIRVDAALRLLGRRGAKAVELFSCAVMFLMFSGLAIYLYKSLARNYARGTTSESLAQVPLWIPQTISLIGLMLLLLALLVRAARVARGRPYEVEHVGEL